MLVHQGSVFNLAPALPAPTTEAEPSGDPASASPVARRRCPHSPPCPTADSADHDAARVTSRHCDQGWSLLCNGVILFEDTGEILPTGRTVEPRRPLPRPGCVPRPPAPRRGAVAAPTPV
ncbi:conserved hypothetical protein [Frankia sp. Hr75.2]|uniref:DUF5999 family protein n=1 Tax=Parafrankia soli TaxID=2599596 RepID=UPI00005441E9|nr:hypothetical protein Franean1_1857 [Frankia sp. EAN1pec]CAI7979844.1 conserved hypothetical protein [Frankia sp. Hr75.2]